MKYLCIIICIMALSPLPLLMANDWHDQADTFWNQGVQLEKKSKYKEAIVKYKESAYAEKKSRNIRVNEFIRQLNKIGEMYRNLYQYKKSLHYYTLTLKVSEKYLKPQAKMEALIDIGFTYYKMNDYPKSLLNYNSAYELAREFKEKDRLAFILNRIGMLYRLQREYPSALSYYQKALPFIKGFGAEINKAVIHSNLGTVYYYQGKYYAAIEEYQLSFATNKKLNREQDLSIDYSNLGTVYMAIGSFGKGFSFFNSALEIDRKLGNKVNIAARLNMIGDIYSLMNPEKALAYYQESLAINKAIGNDRNTSVLLSKIGDVYDILKDYNQAVLYYIQALAIDENLKSQENIALKFEDIGMVYERRGRYNEAYDYYLLASKRDQGNDDKIKISENLRNMGRTLLNMKKYEEALTSFKRALAIDSKLKNYPIIADDFRNIGESYLLSNNYDEAVKYLSLALVALGKIKEFSPHKLIRIEGIIYELMIQAYSQAGKHYDAYRVSEIYSTKKINTGTLFENTINVADQYGIPTDTLVIMFSNISQSKPVQIIIDNDKAYSFEMDKLKIIKNIYNKLGKEIESYIHKNVKGFAYKTKDFESIFNIEFQKIVLFYRGLLVKKNIDNNDAKLLTYLGREFYTFFFRDIEKYFVNKKKFIIKPAGVLSILPFEVFILPDGSYLAEKYELKYTCSYTATEKASQRTYDAGADSVFIFGDPVYEDLGIAQRILSSVTELDYQAYRIMKKMSLNRGLQHEFGLMGKGNLKNVAHSMLEVKSVMDQFGKSELLTGRNCTETEIKSISEAGRLAKSNVIHFATRGIIIREMPELAAIALSTKKQRNRGDSNDGYMNVSEISKLRLRTDMVALSYNTITGDAYNREEGLWRLCYALLNAGSKSVTVSQWGVSDKARALFWAHVYYLANKEKMSFSKAITETKRAFISGSFKKEVLIKVYAGDIKKLAAPYYWAPFVYYGN